LTLKMWELFLPHPVLYCIYKIYLNRHSYSLSLLPTVVLFYGNLLLWCQDNHSI